MELSEKQKHKWEHDSNAVGYFTRCTQCGIIIYYPNPLPESICTHHKEERPSATEPAMKCRSCDTTTDKTPPFAACGICGAQLVDKVATEPAAQDEALVEETARAIHQQRIFTYEPLSRTPDGEMMRNMARAALTVARQHFAAHPVTAQVPEGYVRLEDVRAALLSVCGESCYWLSVAEKALDRLAPKQKTPEERVTEIKVEFSKAVSGAHEDQWWVSRNGKQVGGAEFKPLYFYTKQDAELYATGLRVQVAGGSHE